MATQAEANAAVAAGCAQIQAGIAWYEANLASDELTTLHGLLNRIAARAEVIAGVPSGTFANPDDGTPKPG